MRPDGVVEIFQLFRPVAANVHLFWTDENVALQPNDWTLLMNDRQLLEGLQLHIKGKGTNAKNDQQQDRLVVQFARLNGWVRTTHSLGSHDFLLTRKF